MKRNLFEAGGGIVASLVADDSGLYIATLGGQLYCLNRITGQIKWQYFGKGPLNATPVVIGDTVYQADPVDGMCALDKIESPDAKKPMFNRTPRWSSLTLKQIVCQDDKYVYAVRKDGALVAFDKKAGEQAFVSGRKDLLAFALNIRDAVIYAATPDGKVLAIRPELQPGKPGLMVEAARSKRRPAAPRRRSPPRRGL